MSLRIGAVIGIVLALLYLPQPAFLSPLPVPNYAAIDPLQFVRDIVDDRPAYSVLIVGNSRTYFHRMPAMVRRIADSAGETRRFDVEAMVWGGAGLSDYQRSPRVRSALGKHWDSVIFQARSAASSTEQNRASFFSNAVKLVSEAREGGNEPAFIVNWAYAKSAYQEASDPEAWRRRHCRIIQNDYETLKARTGASLINVANAWERLLNDDPPLSLYEDVNHPTVYGSYLEALVVYARLTGKDVAKLTYAPSEIKPADAALIRSVVSDMAAQNLL